MLNREELLKAVSWTYNDWYNYAKYLNDETVIVIETMLFQAYKTMITNNLIQNNKRTELKKLFYIYGYENFLFHWKIFFYEIRKEINKITEENFRGFFDAFIERSPLFASLI